MKRKGKLASVLNRSTVATLLAVMLVISSFSAIAVSSDLFSSGGKKDIVSSSAPTDTENFDYYAENGFTQSNIMPVNAAYYDYLSDAERSNGWLYPIQAGTGFEGSQNNWYPFWNFNNDIKNLASSNSSWKYPLYFGNFCNTGRAYMGKNNDHGGYHNGSNDDKYADINNTGYMQAKRNLVRWDYFANNSNSLAGYHYAIRDLAYNKLVDENIRVGTSSSNINMPYFDSQWLGNKAKKIKSYFPFRISSAKANDGVTDVTRYVFSSEQATDNVYFTWNSDGSPKSVKYGSGKSYGIEDGYQYFMGKDRPDYLTEDPYGIFPFNNKQEGTNRRGNSNLDYGFGIRLDIDFRVPVDGLLAGNTPVTFEYSGDDDLWVYLTDNEGNSTMVLDLGGNHKMTEGKLDFSTMTATSENTAYRTTDKSNMLFIADYSDMPNCTYRWDAMYMWAWGGSSTGEWFQLAYDEASSTYYACKDQVGSKGHKLSQCTSFKLFGERSTSSFYKNDKDISFSSVSWGKKYTLKRYDNNEGFWLDMSSQSAPSTSNLPYFTKVTEGFGFEKSGSGYKTLDPKKTYHMTVFYMERGTLESNFKVAFTMLPVTSEFNLEKTVNVADVNTALQSQVKNLDDFNFLIKAADSAAASPVQVGTKDYTHISGSTHTDKKTSAGKLSLKDSESAYFNSQFKTGQFLEVTESDGSNLTYTTKWEVKDNDTNASVSTGTAKEAKFQYGTDVFVDYTLGYENTPQVGDIEITKAVEKAGTEAVDDEFTVKVEIDLDGGGSKYSYTTYALDCERYDKSNTLYPGVSKLNADGTIKLKENERIVIPNLPVGANYRVSEVDIPSGYTAKTPSGIEAGVEGTVAVKTSTVGITNKKSEGSASIDVIKKLDGTAYNSSDYSSPLFSFSMKELNADGTTKTGGASETVKTVSAGTVSFKPFKYTSAGTYYYRVTESNISGRGDDYKMDGKAVFAKVVVADSTAGFDIDTTYAKANKDSRPDTLSYSTSTDEKTFTNITYGQLKVTKANELDADGKAVSGTELEGAKFELRDGNNNVVATVITNNKGVAEFKNLPIKDSEGNFISYTVKEVKAPAGYLISNKAKKTFTFEGAANAEGTYTRSYAFVNLKLEQPDSGEIFSSDHLLIGGSFMLLSAICGMAYLIFIKKRPQSKKFFTRK